MSHTGPMLSLWQKSGINFMVQDKFVSDFQCSVRFKEFKNLSQTMDFVVDWANAKSMAKIRYKFHGLRQI